MSQAEWHEVWQTVDTFVEMEVAGDVVAGYPPLLEPDKAWKHIRKPYDTVLLRLYPRVDLTPEILADDDQSMVRLLNACRSRWGELQHSWIYSMYDGGIGRGIWIKFAVKLCP